MAEAFGKHVPLETALAQSVWGARPRREALVVPSGFVQQPADQESSVRLLEPTRALLESLGHCRDLDVG